MSTKGCPQKGDVITMKHVKFAEDKLGYEWIYRKATQAFRHNEIWSDDEDSIEDVDDTCDSKSDEEATDIIPSEDADKNIESIPEDMELVGARSAEEKRKAGRPKKKIRNPYRRKGKLKEAQTTNEEESSNEQSNIEVNLIEVSELQNVQEALASPQAKQWKCAMKEKLDSLTQRKTWETAHLPEGKRCVGCKWVFKLKTDADGKITRYKARLVAQGFTQEKGIDYAETYTSIANFSMIRLLLALAVKQ